MRKTVLSALLFCLSWIAMYAQVVQVSPAYPTIDDTVTISFNAAQGSGGLFNISPVYAHTGLITALSGNPGDWQYKKSSWESGNDSTILMTQTAVNQHEISFVLKDWYGLGLYSDVRHMMFVFRDSTGNNTGKNFDGSDIAIAVYPKTGGFTARMKRPLNNASIFAQNDPITVEMQASATSQIRLYEDNILVGQTQPTGTSLTVNLTAGSYGRHDLRMVADDGFNTVVDTLYYIVQPPVPVADPPATTGAGITYLNSTTARLLLQAPNKNFVYVIGDFNDWQVDPAYLMNRTTDGERYWLDISGLTPGQEYAFQYFVDSDIRIADPWAEKILDPFADPLIAPAIYPNLKPYPTNKTNEIVSILQTDKPQFNWQHDNYQRPDTRDLVIYELLVRDFVQRHDYKTVMDSLTYLKKLGINAIELMPVMEFDGNGSWGYGPAFFFAADKYYGPENNLKALIDSAHALDIAIIADVALNHVFGQSPLLRLYYDEDNDQPTAGNPWLNVEPTHPFNVGYDFNHDSWYTENVVDTVLSHWVKEFHVDGFRLDLSKGFTQNWTVGDIGAWSAKDQSRIDNLKRLADVHWMRHPGSWLILEHFANNDEETELAGYGFMLWGKATDPYKECTMGWPTGNDFEWYVSHQARGWAFHNLVGFMESHDEERLMYENLNYGNSWGGYDTRDLSTALWRMGTAASCFFTIPGPKMMWMFGELGYDYSINYACRTCPKPIKWEYWEEYDRQKLFKIYAAIIKLKTNYTTFRSSSYDMNTGDFKKTIHVNDAGMNATVIANFDVAGQDVWTGFQHTGNWYDYLTGNVLNVTDPNMMYFLNPGEYRIFVDQQIPVPDLSVVITGEEAILPDFEQIPVQAFPNPFSEEVNIRFVLEESAEVKLEVRDLMGRKVWETNAGTAFTGESTLKWDGTDRAGTRLPAGVYTYKLIAGKRQAGGKIVLEK